MQSLNLSTTSSVADIQTPRLDLIAITPGAVSIEFANAADFRVELGARLVAVVPPQWPPENWEPHVLQYLSNLFAENPRSVGWTRYVALRGENTRKRVLIGTVGSFFPEPGSSQVEVGYGILPEFHRRGYATEALAGMLAWVHAQAGISTFVAQTFPHLLPSIRVLEKSGFQFAGPGFEEGTILYRRENFVAPPAPAITAMAQKNVLSLVRGWMAGRATKGQGSG